MSEEGTYLGAKGYTIYKESLTIEEQILIREELTVKANVPKNLGIKSEAFPIYRESKNKFYIPRYYGIDEYGYPNEVKIGMGEEINIKFNGELREFQKPVVQKYMESIDEKTGCGGGLIDVYCGFGKTILTLNIISKVKRKTLIIVHKSFLLNQWIERINEFLPDARIGQIQGQIIDIDNKDIVIGMLQSLSMKKYPHNMFESFGLTVIDECHHISSEVFSRSLLSIVTRKMLGLSATMQRKDGLTKVFKMFIGDIIFKGERKKDDTVLVKGIEYITNDEEFNEIKRDWKGQVAYSSMISKLCSYNHRSEFIITVITNELKKNSKQQIMVLGQNKDILVYLYKAIEYRNIASVGYYVGGMKEADLKISESKTIVIATYAMAAEGLDIKTLSTLILVTPRTDITQAVGRILRIKHEQPLVIDIIDKHEVFKKQWLKRKKFYQTNKYEILYTTSDKYISDIWENISDKKNKKSKKDEHINELSKLMGTCLI